MCKPVSVRVAEKGKARGVELAIDKLVKALKFMQRTKLDLSKAYDDLTALEQMVVHKEARLDGYKSRFKDKTISLEKAYWYYLQTCHGVSLTFKVIQQKLDGKWQDVDEFPPGYYRAANVSIKEYRSAGKSYGDYRMITRKYKLKELKDVHA